MPELPEVETTMRMVRPALEGRTLTSADATWVRSLGGLTRPAFRRAVVGCTITRLRRRAKYIVADLSRSGSPDGALLIHLRMSGRLLIEPEDRKIGDHIRVHVGLDDGHRLDFLDVRKFGRFTYVADAEAALAHLGPEPLGRAFTASWLHRALKGRKRMLKPLLLDQTFVAGLGNIYVDEALFESRLHPLRRSDTVSRASADTLHGTIRRILADAVEKKGASFDTFYRTPEGQPGAYQDEFQVYGRHGKPCRRCEATVVRLVVGQRGTHICRRCQRAPRLRV